MEARRDIYFWLVEGFADWEAAYALAHIANPVFQKEPGRYRVRTVAFGREPIVSMGGLRVMPDLALEDASADSCALLILPGSEAWMKKAFAPLESFVRGLMDGGGNVAAICGATYALARWGLLDARPHTGPAREFLAASGYRGGDFFVEAPVVSDGNLITALPTAAVAFAEAIFARLDLFSPAVREAWLGLYTSGDPRFFAELLKAAAESSSI